MRPFHVSVHARPPGLDPGPTIEVEGQRLATLAVTPESLATPFERGFEQAAAELAALPRLFLEPDGSFVWAAPRGQPAWQIEGNLFDRGGRLLFVDLKGQCPSDELDRLLRALGWPHTPLMFQLARQAALVSEAEFRRFIFGGPGSAAGV
jgi:hypothetical protein